MKIKPEVRGDFGHLEVTEVYVLIQVLTVI